MNTKSNTMAVSHLCVSPKFHLMVIRLVLSFALRPGGRLMKHESGLQQGWIQWDRVYRISCFSRGFMQTSRKRRLTSISQSSFNSLFDRSSFYFAFCLHNPVCDPRLSFIPLRCLPQILHYEVLLLRSKFLRH